MQLEDSPTLSIIIVTWNGKKYALECLESLRQVKDEASLEVIVVDNASEDGTPDAIAEQYPEVHLLRNAQNLGFAKANNLGIAACTGQYVALVNSDVVVPAGCIATLVQFLREHPDVGLIGPKMLGPNGELGQSVNRYPTVWRCLCTALGLHLLFPNSKLLGGYLLLKYPYDKTEDVDVLTGWFWASPREAVMQVGGLDERFFMYGEDLDWSYRFKKNGWRVVFVAEAEALHYGAASSAKAPTRFYVEKTKANLQYFQKHFGVIGKAGFLAVTVLHELIRLVAYAAAYCVAAGRREQFAGKVQRSVWCLKWVLQ
jgi:GT2 family glycosyltransferase